MSAMEPHDWQEVPVGLEFKEEYMTNAFALYDSERKKRKKSGILWWVPAMVFAGLLSMAMMRSMKIVDAHAQASTKMENELVDLEDEAIQAPPVEQDYPTMNKKQFSVVQESMHSMPATVRSSSETVNLRGEDAEWELIELNDARAEGDRIDGLNLRTTSPLGYTIRDDQFHLQPSDRWNARTNTRHRWYLGLGVNTLFGMQELKNTLRFKQCISLSYEFSATPRWSVGGELSYHASPRVTYQRNVSDTSSNDGQTIFLKTSLSNLGIEPYVKFNLNKQHFLWMGFSVDYLLVPQFEKIKSETQNVSLEKNKQTAASYYAAFNKVNTGVSLGYGYSVSEHVSFRANYRYGLTDVTLQSADGNPFDRYSKLQLSVQFKF